MSPRPSTRGRQQRGEARLAGLCCRKNNENRVGTRRDARSDVENSHLYHCVVTKFQVLRNNEIGNHDQRILHGPEGRENNGISQVEEASPGGAERSDPRWLSRGYKLEEIDHLPPETIARAGEGDLGALRTDDERRLFRVDRGERPAHRDRISERLCRA